MKTDARTQGLFKRPLAFGTLLLAAFVGSALFMFWPWKAEYQSAAQAAPAVLQMPGRFYPTEQQWKSLSVATADSLVFRPQYATDGKIAVADDRNTPIFASASGRIGRLIAQPGDHVEKGDTLFTVEAPDMVRAQDEYLAAGNALEKSRSQLNLVEVKAKRQKGLYAEKLVALRDVQESEAELAAAQSDLRSAESALQAARNRLRILGKTDKDIAALGHRDTALNASTSIYAPISGTVIQRKVGPGQYVDSGTSDPAYVIGDLSTVWLIANIRESDVARIRIGQDVEVTVLAYPGRTFPAKVTYMAAAVDAGTRRLRVRAEIANPDNLLRPEMFASFSIFTGDGQAGPGVPLNAVVYEGSAARLFVVHEDGGVELRNVRTGIADKGMLQIVEGLQPGEKVIVKGSLFIDRAANSDS